MAIYAVWKHDGKVTLTVANGPAEAVKTVAQRMMTKYLDRGYNTDNLDGTYCAVRVDTEPIDKVIVEGVHGYIYVRREE